MADPQLPIASKPTFYFGYGSNLWLEQMHIRCPTSQYLGVARLNNYRWIINDRGYANIIEVSKDSTTGECEYSSPTKDSNYENVVFGLVYSLEAEDEKRLDRNEGVPIAYTKEDLICDFWSSDTSHKVDTSKQLYERRDLLVYIDRKRMTPDKPRREYIYRMNRGIDDALKMGVPEQYVRNVMREFIPAEETGERRSMEEFAMAQAAQFRDESGVFQ
jgi:gamma-glutamylcyclotransferase